MRFERSESHSPKHERTTLVRKAAAFSIAVPLLFGATACADGEGVHLPSFVSGTNYLDRECAPVSEQTIDQTKEVFVSSWQSPEAIKNTNQSMEALDARRLTVASELGLTVYDPMNEFAALDMDAVSDTPTIPTKEYLSAATEMLARYGVTIKYTSEDVADGSIKDVTPFTKQEVLASDDAAIKQQLNGFIQSIGVLPVELVKDMGLKKIILVHIGAMKAANGDQTAGFAELNSPNPDTIYVDPTKLSSSMLPHEMFHLWDSKECGPTGMSNDVQFNALNPAPTKNGATSFYAAHSGYYDPISAAWEESSEGLTAALNTATTPAERNVIQQQINAIESHVAVEEPYGFSNMDEDKATIGAQLLGSTIRYYVEDPDSPIIEQKSLLLTARLFKEEPKSVEYLARTGLSALNATNVLAK